MKPVRSRREVVSGLACAGVLGLSGAVWPRRARAAGERAQATVTASDVVLRAAVPDHFLSFNLNANTLDSDHWSERDGGLSRDLVDAMRVFKGAYLRYPGGNISNHFASDWAVGPPASRRPQRGTEHGRPAPVRFGPREYFDFAATIGARTWYTLNLVGWDADQFGVERPSAEVAAANARLAELRRQQDRTGDGAHLYHLGNELDRNRYGWTAEKYIARCRETMAAVKAADPAARFVAFLRDFDLGPKARSGSGRGRDHASAVLAALPEIADASLQIYYDRPANEGSRFDLAWRWRLVDNFLEAVSRPAGRRVDVWITEHAQAHDLSARDRPRRLRLATTSGIGGAVASADFVIGALQRPRIAATFWHALGGGVWWDLFEATSGDLQPTPAYRVFKLLREQMAGEVVTSDVRGSRLSGYAGGYDLAAAVLRQAQGGHSVVVANRAPVPADLTLVVPRLAGRPVRPVVHSVAALAPESQDLDDELRVGATTDTAAARTVDAKGRLEVSVRARSVSVIQLDPATSSGG